MKLGWARAKAQWKEGEKIQEDKDVNGDVFSTDDNDWWGMVKVNVKKRTAKCIEGSVPRGKGESKLNEEHDHDTEELKIKYSRKKGPHWDYVQYYVCKPVEEMDDVLEKLDGLEFDGTREDDVWDEGQQDTVLQQVSSYYLKFDLDEKDFSKVEKEEMAKVIGG